MAKVKMYGRKGRKDRYQDPPDDYSYGEQYDDDKMVHVDEAGEDICGVGALAQMAGLSADHPLINFYMEDKAAEFIDKYTPCNEQDPLMIRFTDSRLRSYFKAYVCTNGDPMKIYMLRLRLAGFHFSTDITGELVLIVKERIFQKGNSSWMLEMEKGCGEQTEQGESIIF